MTERSGGGTPNQDLPVFASKPLVRIGSPILSPVKSRYSFTSASLMPRSVKRATTARPTNAGVSEMAKCGDRRVASRQLSSRTPYASSIASDRSQPGVSDTAVAPWGPSSCASANAIRFTAALARSKKKETR